MDIQATLKQLNISPRHALGQNFLRNDSIADAIVGFAEPEKGDTFLEVGPGLGILTTRLLDAGASVVAVEKDTEVFWGLEEIFEDDDKKLTLVNKDILDTDLTQFKYNKVISNLPFQISSPFTFKILEKPEFDLGVVTYQLEFARRLTARPGLKDYSRLTVMAYYRAEMKVLRRIKAGSFYPRPKVDGAVIQMIPRKEPPFHVENETFFENMVRELFNHRRKTIRNSLKGAYSVLGKGMEKEAYKAVVNEMPMGDRRPEMLEPEELGELGNKLFDVIRG